MTEYYPHHWKIMRIENDDDEVLYKVLGGWSGGYLDGDSWRINSGIAYTSYLEEDDCYLFHGHSGSIYKCHVGAERMSMAQAGIWVKIQGLYGDKITLIDMVDLPQELLPL